MKTNLFNSVSVITDNFLTYEECGWTVSKRGSNILLYTLVDQMQKAYNVEFKIFQQGKKDRILLYKGLEIKIIKSEDFSDFKERLTRIDFTSDIIHYNNIDLFTNTKKRDSLLTATIHTNSFLDKSKANEWLEKNIIFFNKVVVVNRAYKELFPSTTLIKNGIPKEVFNYCSYKQLEKPLKIFFPNIDSPKKNRAFAIDLIEKLDEKHKGIFKLILVGEKENLNIDNKLYEFVGLKKWGQEMSALYRNSFITIIPSISESCSLCTLESMSSGTVVIANDIPGIRDYVLNNKTGFLISVNDFRKWVKKIETLLRDQILYDRIQKSAKDSIHENFNVERMAEEYYLMWLKLFKMKYAKK